jgi:RluA family pseudouridine synthase
LASPAISLLHQDVDLVVADKPAGLATVAERDPSRDNLRARLEQQLGARLWTVHRLDKDVSGVIVFARSAAVHRRLSLAFERHEARKTYLAIVRGVPTAADGTIETPLREFGSGRIGVDCERGRPSLTHWKLLRSLPGSAAAPALALLEVHPVTGRRHQIRVHLHSIGHTVVGDPLYGERTAAAAATPRLMLHAHRLQIADPPLDVTSPLPAELAALLGAPGH